MTKTMSKRYFITYPESMLGVRYGVGFSRATKSGGPVSKYAMSWKDINGIWINTEWRCFWILFRRPSY
jgi:hypothetical protein